MTNDLAGIAGLAVGTIGTVLIAGEVVKAVKHTARQASRQPPKRRMPRKKDNYLDTINLRW